MVSTYSLSGRFAPNLAPKSSYCNANGHRGLSFCLHFCPGLALEAFRKVQRDQPALIIHDSGRVLNGFKVSFKPPSDALFEEAFGLVHRVPGQRLGILWSRQHVANRYTELWPVRKSM